MLTFGYASPFILAEELTLFFDSSGSQRQCRSFSLGMGFSLRGVWPPGLDVVSLSLSLLCFCPSVQQLFSFLKNSSSFLYIFT